MSLIPMLDRRHPPTAVQYQNATNNSEPTVTKSGLVTAANRCADGVGHAEHGGADRDEHPPR
jgi:hypothetical protein